MPKKQKNNKRKYNTYTNTQTTNLKLIKQPSTWFKVNKNPFKYQLALKFKLPGYATHEYEISYQFRKEDKKVF